MHHHGRRSGLQPPKTGDTLLLATKASGRATGSDDRTQGGSLIAQGTRPAMVDQLLRIHEYERQRMGQELHDSAGQLVVSLHLSIAHLRKIEQNSGHDSLMEEIQDTVRQIDKEIRALAFLHYPAELAEEGLCAAVQSLVYGFGRRTGIRTSFACSGDQTSVAVPISTTMLRVAQEALVNIHRHSHASRAKVVLKTEADHVHLSVSDDGIGIPPTVDDRTARGIGLLGMRHRVEMQGGRFRISNLKHGTKVSATVPLQN